ncbi:MAG TPA: TonB-dependent receptor [Kaistella chaponensis]|uniref:TonB-dependent receptor n=1 Tax=Kaistella chaponensis TaxID=713588 RepID=UPI002B90D0D2|nr:TonB-dependent receptor [Kaistella chaponensis]HPW87635.1 TonB-dependent receptor [Kaistella chaponensis]
MKSNLLKKSMLTVVITLSTASVYYAQSAKDTLSREADIEQVVLTGVADIAKDRKTPVAVSTIKEAQIVEKLGNQEFPEILNATPSVYATKGGGGFGESKLNIRGFSQENIAVMVNGMPVNDMENGRVFWSNWAGLSDVTSAMQVQRGLGSSKLAIASVGGTVNILTRAADKKQGGVVSVGVGNNDYQKSLFAYNTGKSQKGWSSSFLMSRTAGSTFADATKFEGYNYYFALGFQPNKKHDFQFTLTGAPQTHNNRSTYISISDYIKYSDESGVPDTQYNSDYGFRNGELVSNRINYYHKPVMSLNWDWTISDKSKLNTIVYASFGRGGGVNGNAGRVGGTKAITAYARTTDGLLNFDQIFTENAAVAVNATSAPLNTLVQVSSINSHNWYGAISSFNHKLNDNLNFTVGIDGRYYYGYHYQTISNLLGATAFKDNTNKNIAPNIVTNTFGTNPDWNPFGGKINNLSDMVTYDNDGEVIWYGGFGQLEYSNDKLSAFLQGAISEQGFQRIDNFIVDGVSLLNGTLAGTPATNQPTATNPVLNTKTGFKNLFGYNVKAGANYNIDEHHNVFGNIGYYSKQPFLNAVYPNNKNFLNPNLTNEKIFGVELGYGFRSGIFTANVNLYRTSWKDRFQRRSNITVTYPDPSNPTTNITTTSAYANISGITEIHQGLEIDATANVTKMISLNGMLSMGDWFYEGNATGDMFTETNEPIALGGSVSGTTLYLDKVKVGNSAQFTAGAGFTLKPTDWVSFDAMYRGVRNLYANVNPLNFLYEASGKKGALELPTFGLVDLGLSFKVKMSNAKQYFTLRGNVYNLLDKTYIAESNTNTLADLTKEEYSSLNPTLTAAQLTTNYNNYVSAGNWNGVSQQNQVFFGFGRTWAATLSFNF